MGEPRSIVGEKTLEIIATMEEGLKNMNDTDKGNRLCEHRTLKRHDQGINNRMIGKSAACKLDSDFEIVKRHSDSH